MKNVTFEDEVYYYFYIKKGKKFDTWKRLINRWGDFDKPDKFKPNKTAPGSEMYHFTFRARQLEISSTYFQYGDATADDNIVADIFHYASRFTGDEGQQDRRLV